MLEAARREYHEDEVQPEVLKILEPGNEFLQDVVDQIGKTRRHANKAQVACFYELKSSNVGRIVGNQDRTVSLKEDCVLCLIEANYLTETRSKREFRLPGHI